MPTNPTIIPERVEKLRSITPETGSHPAPDNGTPVGCEVELISWAAGMEWSDATPCVSPVVAAFLRRWNDDLDDEGRARLHAHCLDRIEAITSTGGDGRDEERAWMATDWLVRVHAPAWLELAGVTDCASELRDLPPLTAENVKAAQPTINKARKDGAATWAAARDAARAAAWDAARAAAWDAAWAAAWAAARDAARDAAWKSLTPTVTTLQASALELLDTMIGKDWNHAD